MNMDFSIASLILNASPIVQMVLLLLLIASVGSWTIIIEKSRMM